VYRQSGESDVPDPILRRRSTAPTTPTHVGTADADSEARNNEMVDDSPGWSNNEMVEDSPGGSRQMSRFGASGASKCEDIDSGSNGAEEITTMVIRKIPFRSKQSDVVSELDHSGFGGTYDWLYMPSNLMVASKSEGHGKSYVFVNFIKPEFAIRSIGVSVRGQIIALKLENLSMGMKADEMSSSDEELLLKLEPGKAS